MLPVSWSVEPEKFNSNQVKESEPFGSSHASESEKRSGGETFPPWEAEGVFTHILQAYL